MKRPRSLKANSRIPIAGISPYTRMKLTRITN
jgi:hypothetical protein